MLLQGKKTRDSHLQNQNARVLPEKPQAQPSVQIKEGTGSLPRRQSMKMSPTKPSAVRSQPSLKSPSQMLCVAATWRQQMTCQVSLPSQQVPSPFSWSISPRIFGRSTQTRKINMVSHSSKQYFQAAKTQTRVSESTREVTTRTWHLQTSSILSSKTTTNIKRQTSTSPIWTLLSSTHHLLQGRMQLWSRVRGSAWGGTWMGSLLDPG